MADLPQHAAQISIWSRLTDPTFGYQEIYTRNWFTPYLFGYLLTVLLTPLMSVKAATTCVITAALLGVPIATRALICEVGGSRWWVFAVFPSLFGFCFDWGFYNFLVGIPIALLFLVLALRYADHPTPAHGVLLTLGLVGLFFVHVLLFVYVSLIVGATLVLSGRPWKRSLAALSPLLVLAPMVLLWLYITRDSEAMTHRAMIWELEEYAKQGHRSLRFFSEVAGDQLGAWTLSVGALTFAIPFIVGARPSRSLGRWIPFGVTLLAFFAVPHEFLGTAYLYPRFAVFAIPTWLYALERPEHEVGTAWRLSLGPALAVACTVATTMQFWAYEPEAAGLAGIIERMPSNASVLSVPIDRKSDHVRTPVFLHTPLWYQAEKGGVVDFSFAVNFPLLFRYKPEHEPRIPRLFVWDTNLFDWKKLDGARYNFLIVRELLDDYPSALIADREAPVSFLGHVGPWQLFERD
jgi:hypothetical protein